MQSKSVLRAVSDVKPEAGNELSGNFQGLRDAAAPVFICCLTIQGLRSTLR